MGTVVEALLAPLALEVEKDHFAAVRAAEHARTTERLAATAIQAAWRGFVVRKNLATATAAATVIQAGYRGHLGRLRALKQSVEVARALRAAYFGAAATEIQRAFRGYYSRKYVHSFYARQAYLAAVSASADELRATMAAQYEEQKATLAAEMEEEAHAHFTKTIQGLHHLVSTESSPGIYNSPFALITGGKPAVAGKPLEDHLRSARHGISLLPRTVTTGPGTPGLPLESTRASIQATGPYTTRSRTRGRRTPCPPSTG